MDDSVLILEQDHDGDGSELRLAVDPARWRCESAVLRARRRRESAVLRATGGAKRALLQGSSGRVERAAPRMVDSERSASASTARQRRRLLASSEGSEQPTPRLELSRPATPQGCAGRTRTWTAPTEATEAACVVALARSRFARHFPSVRSSGCALQRFQRPCRTSQAYSRRRCAPRSLARADDCQREGAVEDEASPRSCMLLD